MILSICIPNYNRPNELKRLLNSIDSKNIDQIEIVICEDRSPKMEEVRGVVGVFKDTSPYIVKYIENEKNLGYDKNIRELIKNASGDWIIFMGNDDEFVPNSLDKLLFFLEENNDLGYILKSHFYFFKNNKKEVFRYFKGNKFFSAGKHSYIDLFRKSVFISGFTIKRKLVLPYLVDDFDGTLLFQLYILAEVSLKYPSAYFDTPLTQQYQEGFPEFGSSEYEKSIYTPGSITIDNSLNFLRGYFKITNFIDEKYNLDSTRLIKIDMSKYFYPNLAIQRKKGIKKFIFYVRELNKIGFNCTFYYYIYVLVLLLLGKNICDNIIRIMKNILGKTPRL